MYGRKSVEGRYAGRFVGKMYVREGYAGRLHVCVE